MEKVERIPTGISGFDPLIDGGIPKGHSVAIIGGAGTGKTILLLQSLANIANSGKKVLLLISEESKDKIVGQAESIGLNIDELEKRKEFIIYLPEGYDIEVITMDIKKIVKEKGIEIIGVDSMTMLLELGYLLPEGYRMTLGRSRKLGLEHGEPLSRKRIHLFISELSRLGLILFLTAEADLSGNNISKDGIIEYASDGVILLKMSENTGERTISIRKMRNTPIDFTPKIINISDKGIAIEK